MPPKFEVIEDDSEEQQAPAVSPHTLDTILAGLKALPRKTAAAVAACFALVTTASVFCLALLIIPREPNSFQLTGLAGYALFVIAINVINRRK